jgi:hypothetical protein
MLHSGPSDTSSPPVRKAQNGRYVREDSLIAGVRQAIPTRHQLGLGFRFTQRLLNDAPDQKSPAKPGGTIDTWLNSPTPARDKSVNEQHDEGADDRADETGALPWSVPSERVPKIGCDERAHDAQDGRENEAGRLVVTGHDEFGNDTRDEADDYRP